MRAFHSREFLLLWSGQTFSLLGSAVTYLALPLTAIVTLGASPLEMGVLVASQRVPGALFALPAGVLADRVSRRPILIACDAGRMLLIGSIPVAAALDVLTFVHLVIVAFLAGALTVLFDTTYQAFIPTVLDRGALLSGNSALAAGQSIAEIGGSGVAGVVSGAASPSAALGIDAASFGISALTVLGIRPRAAAIVAQCNDTTTRRRTVAEISEGMRYLLRHAILRPVALSAAVVAFFANVQEAVLLLFAYRELHLSAIELGVIYTVSGVVGLGAAVLSERISRAVGVGTAIIVAQAVEAVGAAAFAVAGGPLPLVVLLFLTGEAAFAFGVALFNVTSVSVRQALVPDEILGRVTASSRFFVLVAVPLGALVGGGLAAAMGLRATLAIGAAGIAVASVALVGSRIRILRELPDGFPAG